MRTTQEKLPTGGGGSLEIGSEVVDGTPSNLLFVDEDGNLGQSAQLTWDDGLIVQAPTASDIPLIVKGAASQSVRLQEWQNSSAGVLAFIGVTSSEPRIGIVDIGDAVGRYLYAGNGTSILGKIGLEGAGSSGELYFSAEDNTRHVELYRPASNEFGIKTGGTDRVRINSTGVGLGTTSPTAGLDINSDTIRLRTAKTPSSSGASGNQGDIAWDADYLYIATATNTWKRAAISTW